MAGNAIRLQIHTPVRTVLEKDIDFVLLRSVEGDMGVLHGHEPCAVQLDIGVLRAYVDKQETDTLMVMGGFAMVREDGVTILTALAEPPDQVERALAEMKNEQMANRLKERSADLEIHRAETALRRTLVQMDISSYSILHGSEDIGGHQDGDQT